MIRTPLSRSKGQGHQAALLTAVLGRQAAAAVCVGTCWPWETAATLLSARWRKALRCLRGEVRGGAYRGSCPPTACYWQDAVKRQTAGIKFTHRPKIRFFAPQWRLVAPIHVKFGRADWHMGLLGCAKLHLDRHGGWGECGPKISKISTFWQRVASLDGFRNILGAFMRLTILH